MKRSHWIIFPAALLLLIFSSPASAQRQDEAVRLESTLVLIDAIVLSKKTNTIVGDLKREDFTIQENRKKQAITHFSREELPLSVVLLLDVSGSVQPIIGEIQRAALDALARLKPQDKVALMIFASRSKVVADLTRDRAVIRDKLDNIWNEVRDVGHGTSINRGVYEAAHYLHKKTDQSERRAIVVITDDGDTGFLGMGPSRNAVERELYEGGTTLCGIILGSLGGGQKVSSGVLTAMKLFGRFSPTYGSAKHYADRTGGISIKSKRGEIAGRFVEMMELLRTRYTFGYAPADTTPDGKFREITLSVSDRVKKDKGEVEVFARRGYFIRKPTNTGSHQIKK